MRSLVLKSSPGTPSAWGLEMLCPPRVIPFRVGWVSEATCNTVLLLSLFSELTSLGLRESQWVILPPSHPLNLLFVCCETQAKLCSPAGLFLMTFLLSLSLLGPPQLSLHGLFSKFFRLLQDDCDRENALHFVFETAERPGVVARGAF